MSFFSFEKKTVLGVDIGTSSLKIAELSAEANRFSLTNYGMVEFGNANSGDGQDKDKASKILVDDLIKSFKDLIGAAGITGKDAVASIPSFLTFSTTITMPYVSEEEVSKAIQFEARKYIPIPLSEVRLDWTIVDVRKDQKKSVLAPEAPDKPGIDVFLVAVPKEDIARYQTIMKEVGLNLRALELESFALIRALVGNDLSPTVLVNIGGRSTAILIAENGFQRASHDYEIGGFAITNAIARALGINFERAVELQKTVGLRPGGDNVIFQAISSLIDMMVFETNKTIQNYEDQRKTKVTKILLTGGLVNMPGLVEYFSQKLGRPAVAGNSLTRVTLPPELEKYKNELDSSFVVSIGLAMRGFK